MSNAFLNRVKIILCRPEGGLNVGSVCRCMENMGLSRLAIVGDISELNLDHVGKMAIHAIDIFDRAERYESLPEALSHTVLAAGITRRRGSRRKTFSYLPEELADKAAEYKEGTIALVFGNEQSGLSDRELAACTAACHIPTEAKNPSLNLSHAVQVLAYVFYLRSAEKISRYIPVEMDVIENLSETIDTTLKQIGYYDKTDRFGTKQYFRDILSRAGLSRKEAAHMEKVFQKIRYLKK
ncbi:MAG: hypothetical protein B6241_07565 [Spirochaetaceae bacterium 4572_59]|nr:MAG: hypothetical protein B6241_07565 [Spirochaetaceae bacterium 4572_59]